MNGRASVGKVFISYSEASRFSVDDCLSLLIFFYRIGKKLTFIGHGTLTRKIGGSFYTNT